jgi:hypothetical protein
MPSIIMMVSDSVDIFPNHLPVLISLAFHNHLSGEFVAEIIAVTGKHVEEGDIINFTNRK